MKTSTLKLVVVAIAVGGYAVLAQKFFGKKYDRTEWALLCMSLVFIGWAAFWVRKRRTIERLESMRDSALW